MANRTFTELNYTLVKRKVELYAAVLVGDGVATLQRWNYPTLGGGANAQTYTTAATAAANVGNAYPLQYNAGAEGVRSVTRTGDGLWTVKFQDNYQRCLGVMAAVQIAGGVSNTIAVGINSTLTNMKAQGGSTVGIALMSSASTASDPTIDGVVLLTFILADATEP